MRAKDLPRAVDRAAVQALAFVCCVLDLEPGFDMLDRGGDEGDCEAGQQACEGVAEGGELVAGFLNGCFWASENGGPVPADIVYSEDVFVEDSSVECQGA